MSAQPDTRETIADFIARTGITMIAERIASRSDLPQDDWSKSAFHYRVTLQRGGLVLSTLYSMGSGNLRWKTREEARKDRYGTGAHYLRREGFGTALDEAWKPGEVARFWRETPTIRLLKKHLTVPVEPDAASVLDSLRSDAQSVESAIFEDWCGDLGYDTDSRKAERIYRACQDGATQLRAFLGRDLYGDLLECEPL